MTDDTIDYDAGRRILSRMDGDPDYAEEIAACIREHTAARGIDLWAVEIEGYSASDWAEMTDRDRSTVARNVRRANDAWEARMQEKRDDE